MSLPAVIGVISDTHGLLRPEALEALQGSELIIHAGDVGESPAILESLRAIAPVVAVRGNIDCGAWALQLPVTAVVEAHGALLYVIHNLQELDLKPDAAGFAIVISGHSHKASRTERDGVIYLNPGSAGPRRFQLPISLARIDLRGETIGIEIRELRVAR
jgi:putative phosphoesterase